MSWIVVVLYIFTLALIFCFSMMQFHLVALYLINRKRNKKNHAQEVPINRYPFVTIQLPVYNEMYVVKRLMEAVAQFDYPKDKFEVQVLDDSDDETTQIIEDTIKELESTGVDMKLVRRPVREGFKAGALKYGLDLAKGEFIAVFDADFLPNKDFLLRTIPHFDQDDNIGVVQTRWEHLNKDYSILTQIQSFGLDAHFTIEQVGRNSGGHFINFNGTAGVWRRQTILDAGNWQADTLTEDLDLSYRAQMKGWRFVYLENVGAPAELPATMNAVKSQQRRWTKGAAETARKNVKKIFKSPVPFGTKVHGAFHLLNSGVFLSILLGALLSIPVLFLKKDVPQLGFLFQVASIFLVSFFSLGLFYVVSFFRINKFSFRNLLVFIGRFPLFLSMSMGLSLHNGIAVFEGYIGKKSPFVRTPKFNILEGKDTWNSSQYRATRINRLTLIEGILAAYFLFGALAGIYMKDFGLVTFHSMLFLGYSAVCFLSVKHAKFG